MSAAPSFHCRECPRDLTGQPYVRVGSGLRGGSTAICLPCADRLKAKGAYPTIEAWAKGYVRDAKSVTEADRLRREMADLRAQVEAERQELMALLEKATGPGTLPANLRSIRPPQAG